MACKIATQFCFMDYNDWSNNLLFHQKFFGTFLGWPGVGSHASFEAMDAGL
jgi:hypothetical protein